MHFDCYEASTRDEQVPATVTAKQGGAKYDNFDTNSSVMYQSYVLDEAANVPAVVTDRTWGAGREQGGDFSFAFTDADDASYDVNNALRSAIDSYKSKMAGVIGYEGGSTPSEPTDPTDQRAESTFTLASAASLTLDQEATSQISVQNAAGSVTYVSNNSDIATVDANGLVTAVAPGKTMIIVTDTGSDAVKGATLTVSVTVIGAVVSDGDVTIEAGELPFGYAVDDATTLAAYTYNNWAKENKLFLADASQHKVTIPAGVKVTAATLYAVNDNNTANKGKITELAGKTFSVDLTGRKSETFATATVDGLNITDELTFTITYKSGVKLMLKVESTSTGIQDVNGQDATPAKAAKFLKDGKLVIKHNGRLYNVTGTMAR